MDITPQVIGLIDSAMDTADEAIRELAVKSCTDSLRYSLLLEIHGRFAGDVMFAKQMLVKNKKRRKFMFWK